MCKILIFVWYLKLMFLLNYAKLLGYLRCDNIIKPLKTLCGYGDS